MFGFFKKKKPETLLVVATLNARLMPLDRAELEDAFDQVCKERQFGAHVTGGGTSMRDNGEIDYCDIDIAVEDYSEERLSNIINVLESMLAPKGSKLWISDIRETIRFGRHEGLALYLNGTDLPAEVYANNDSNLVYQECDRLLEGIGHVASHWNGPTETALYMYGDDFEAMRSRILPFVESNPLCEKSRIERIA